MFITLNITLFDLDNNSWKEKTNITVNAGNKLIVRGIATSGKASIDIHPIYLGQKVNVVARYSDRISGTESILLKGEEQIRTERVIVPCKIKLKGVKPQKRTINAQIKQNNKLYTKEATVVIETGGRILEKQTVTNGKITFNVESYDALYGIKVSVPSKKQPVSQTVTVYKTRTVPAELIITVPLEKGVGKTKTGTESLQQVKMETPQWYFAPGTGELICIEKTTEATELKKNCDYYNNLVRNIRNVNIEIAKLMNNYQKTVGDLNNPADMGKIVSDINKNQATLSIHEDKLRSELQGIKAGSATQMIELFPIHRGGAGTRFGSYKSTFVRSDRMRNHWRRYELIDEADLGEMRAFLTRGADGRHYIDTNRLRESLSPRNMQTKLQARIDILEPTELVLTDWAKKWNENLKTTAIGDENKYIDCGAEAQLMRYVSGLGAVGEWNPRDGRLAAKLEGTAALAIAQGSAAASLSIPHKMGLRWAFVLNGNEYDVGRFRLQLKTELRGFFGASVMVEAGIEVQTRNNTQHIRSRPGRHNDFSVGQRSPRRVTAEQGAQVGGQAGAFAGASVSGKMTGAIEWLNPEDNHKGVAGFKAFVEIGPAIDFQAGAGAFASFNFSYSNGMIRGKCVLGACFGIGAKGELELMIDVKTIAEFTVWVFYQLARAGFDLVKMIVDKNVIQNLSYLQVMAFGPIGLPILYIKFYSSAKSEYNRFVQQYEKYNKRTELCHRILNKPASLKTILPRAKGYLIWILTRHDAWADTAAASVEWERKGTGYKRCVDAVNVILSSIQSQKEWIEVFGAIRNDESFGGHNPNRKALNDFYTEYAGRSSSEIDAIKNRLPENMGWYTVWNDTTNTSQINTSLALLKRYEDHCGALPSSMMCFDDPKNRTTIV